MSAGPGSRSLANDHSTEMTGQIDGQAKSVTQEERPKMLQVQALGEESGNPCEAQQGRSQSRDVW